jgi:hypothetical protein
MQPLPNEGGIPSGTIVVNGYLDMIMLITIASLLIIFAMMLWMGWRAGKRRERVSCPVRLRKATITSSMSLTGKRIDVLRCSIFGNRPITCGKACVHQAHT